MFAEREDGADRLVQAAGDDAHRAADDVRRTQRLRIIRDLLERRRTSLVDAITLQVDLLDLTRVEHAREQGGLVPGDPFTAVACGDRIGQPYGHHTRHVIGLAALRAADERHARILAGRYSGFGIRYSVQGIVDLRPSECDGTRRPYA